MKKKIRFILNPKAGSGLKNKISSLVGDSFSKNDFETEIFFTEHAGHATELSREAAVNNYDIVTAVGGDGTINETAQSLKHTKTSLAIVPTGSGNGFARHFNIPLNIEKAVNIIKKGKTTKADSLLINDKFCLNIAGAGFDAYIAQLFADHGKRGFITYIKLVMKEYFFYREKNYTIEFDGKKIKRNAFLIAVANATQFGNEVKITPQALHDDGLIDMTVLRKIPVYKIIFVLTKLFNGNLNDSKYAEFIRSKSFNISTEEEMPVHIDGEPNGSCKKIVATVEPLSIRLIIP